LLSRRCSIRSANFAVKHFEIAFIDHDHLKETGGTLFGSKDEQEIKQENCSTKKEQIDQWSIDAVPRTHAISDPARSS
jgi:hypothetical protein